MGLGRCYSVIKYLLIVFNFLFWIIGLAAVAFAIWMLVDPTFYVSMVQEANDYLVSTYILLFAGILLVIVGFLGCCGSSKESNCLLITFFSLLLVIVVAELSAGLWGYLNRDTLAAHVKAAMKTTVQDEYEPMENRRQLFDAFQKKLHCCGVEGPSDWIGKREIEFKVSSDANYYRIPESCCQEGISQIQCSDAVVKQKYGSAVDKRNIYIDGCYLKVMEELKNYSTIIVGVGIAILVIQVLGLIFALVLAFAISRSGRYKA